ncbi:MAG: DUF3375 domain-containing protein [Selenomonas bovis]|nr:DUF3375 domain-containing protein [Selenomonas bovis]
MNGSDVNLYSSLRALRQGHAAWRLLAADQAAFIVSFFEREFLRPGRRAIPEAELLRDLEAYLGEVQQAAGESLLRPARAYLLAWADAEHGWLTRFHGADDVPCYDLTAAAEQAVGFVRSLTREEVLGTESRLRTVVSLLDEIAEDRDEDAGRREQRLLARRAEIDAELSELRRTGKVRPRLTAGQVRERYQQARETAAGIVRDFRALEEEFSALERGLMQEVVTWQEGKGELLRRVFAQGDVIRESPQGRSFALFWQFLMQPEEQASLARLLEAVARVPELKDLATADGARLEDLPRTWIRGAAAVQQTIAQLSRQLRHYVDERFLTQERAIFRRIQSLEGAAMAVREAPPQGEFLAIDLPRAAVNLPLDRRLFQPPFRLRLRDHALAGGEQAAGAARGREALGRALSQPHVDRRALRGYIEEARVAAGGRAVTLTEVLARHPLTQGLSELLAYFVLAGRQAGAGKRARQAAPLTSLSYEQEGHHLRARCEEVIFYPAEEKGGQE